MEMEQINNRLERIEKMLIEIKGREEASVLDGSDIEALEAFEREKKEGKLISHEEMKKLRN